jgi:hypothetical protein
MRFMVEISPPFASAPWIAIVSGVLSPSTPASVPIRRTSSWDKVFDAVEHVVTWGLEHRTLGQIDAIGVDEIQ